MYTNTVMSFKVGHNFTFQMRDLMPFIVHNKRPNSHLAETLETLAAIYQLPIICTIFRKKCYENLKTLYDISYTYLIFINLKMLLKSESQ